MQKVAIVTDSVACLTPKQVEQYSLDIIPLNFYAGEQLYRDGVDVSPSEAYELFLKDPDSFKTSGSSPEDCLDAYRKASEKAATVFCITVSSQISVVNTSAHAAVEMARTELPDTRIEIFDAHTAAASEGLVALEAARAAQAGGTLEHVEHAARAIRDKVLCIVFLETLRHVYRSGRIPKIASQVGSALNIRPIFSVQKTVPFVGVARTQKACYDRTFQMMREAIGDKTIIAAVTHAYAPEEAEQFKQKVSKEFNCAELWITEFSPIMGYACGTGTIGVAFYTIG